MWNGLFCRPLNAFFGLPSRGVPIAQMRKPASTEEGRRRLGDRAKRNQPRRSDIASCGVWLAWARIAAPACERTWFFESDAVSDATSVSWMRDSEAAVFVCIDWRFVTVAWKRFIPAPKFARVFESAAIAASIFVI